MITRRSFFKPLALTAISPSVVVVAPSLPAAEAVSCEQPDKLHYRIGLLKIDKIEGVPQGAHVRIRVRNDDFPIAFIRTRHGIQKFALGEHDNRWHLGFQMAANKRAEGAS